MKLFRRLDNLLQPEINYVEKIWTIVSYGHLYETKRRVNVTFLSETDRFFVFFYVTIFIFTFLVKPQIADKGRTIVNESAEILLSRDITSNPLSNVTWFNGSILLKSQYSVPTATYTKRNATCTDTTNLTLIASNGVEGNVTAFVELIVNCEYYNNDNN